MRGKSRKIAISVFSCIVVLGATVVGVVSFAGANQPRWAACASLSGTAKTQANVSLGETGVPKQVGIAFTLTAEDCDSGVGGANGVATRAKITGALKSRSAYCQLSNSSEYPWGQLIIKWQNASGAQIVDFAGKPFIDKVYVRMEPDGVERYDLTGFATSGPSGGGDVSGEIGLARTSACGVGPTKWNVVSSGTLAATEEEVGGNGTADDFVIETPRVLPSTTQAPWTGGTGTFPPTTPTVSWYPSSVPTTGSTATTTTFIA